MVPTPQLAEWTRQLSQLADRNHASFPWQCHVASFVYVTKKHNSQVMLSGNKNKKISIDYFFVLLSLHLFIAAVNKRTQQNLLFAFFCLAHFSRRTSSGTESVVMPLRNCILLLWLLCKHLMNFPAKGVAMDRKSWTFLLGRTYEWVEEQRESYM